MSDIFKLKPFNLRARHLIKKYLNKKLRLLIYQLKIIFLLLFG